MEPTRTFELPELIAATKSEDIPMLNSKLMVLPCGLNAKYESEIESSISESSGVVDEDEDSSEEMYEEMVVVVEGAVV